jgi:hypothetical protein
MTPALVSQENSTNIIQKYNTKIDHGSKILILSRTVNRLIEFVKRGEAVISKRM